LNYDLLGLFPLDTELGLADEKFFSKGELIYKANIELIKTCACLIANMSPFRGPSMDTGTAFEMGFAKALGKLVLGYTFYKKTYLEKVSLLYETQKDKSGGIRDDSGLLIEDFGMFDNLMMVSSADKITSTFEEAVFYASKQLNK
jgi:nucleoside 2-deoxyribosyltransferase